MPSLEPDSPGDALYRYDAPELKAVIHRLDGVFGPHAAAAGTPEQQVVVLLEVQMQSKAGFKHRLWAQTARFAQLHPQVLYLEVVVVVPHRRLRLGPDRLTRQLEGEACGRAAEAAAMAIRQLNRRCGPLTADTTARIQAISVAQLEALAVGEAFSAGVALLDFTGPADLAVWLEKHKGSKPLWITHKPPRP